MLYSEHEAYNINMYETGIKKSNENSIIGELNESSHMGAVNLCSSIKEFKRTFGVEVIINVVEFHS